MRVVLVAVVLIALVAVLGVASAAPAKVADASALKKISPALLSEMGQLSGSDRVKVIVRYKAGTDRTGPFGLLSVDRGNRVRGAVASAGGSMKREFRMLAGFSAEVPADAIAQLAADSAVEAVYPVKTYEILRMESTPLIKGLVAASGYGVNGTAINISVIDTGVYNHSEFQNPSRIIAQKCYCSLSGGCCNGSVSTSNNASDDHGHGTHVAGIAAGQGNVSFGYGVATNASIIAVKVCNSAGSCATDDIISGIEWAATNGANIISMSLGGSVTSDCYEDGSGDWVDNLTAQGILFVIAAGNSGPGVRTVNSPGCAKSALTVGNSMDGSFLATPIDNIASSSSRGPTLDNRTKPDITAPGRWITSTSPVSAASIYNTSTYYTTSGTSMATPYVSGEAALIMERYRQLYGGLPDPSLVKAIIMTAVNNTGLIASGARQRNTTYGAGRVDVNQSLGIIGFNTNNSITQAGMAGRSINTNNGTLVVTLYWPENRTTSNNLDLIVGNSTVNFTQATDPNDTVEQVLLFNASQGAWSIYVNGTNVTGSQRYFLAWSQSVDIPYWSANKTLTTTLYNETNTSYFNLTWTSTNQLSAVFVEGNWSGSVANYTMTSYGGGAYSLNTTLPAGMFYWRGWANDTNGNLNSTDMWIFSVQNSTTRLVLLVNGSTSGRTYDLGDTINITAFANYSRAMIYLDINDSRLGVNFTNSTAYLLNISNASWYGIKYLNITAHYYGDQNSTANSTSIFITVNDTVAPNLTSASISTTFILPGDNITVYVNASDTTINKTWFNVSNTSGFGAMVFMQNVSARFNGTYNTSGLAAGYYNVTTYTNDTNGNTTNLSAGSINVTVPRNITLIFNNYVSNQTNLSITIFYNGTDTVRNFTSNTTGMSSMLPEGIWDVRLSSTFNVTMYSINISTNATGNITIDGVPNANVSLTGFVPLQIVAMESGINFSNATITVPNSSITTSLNITVLACHTWNITNRSCSGSWVNTTINSSITSGLATINTSNFSAFAVMRNTTCGDGVVESGETSSTCCQDAGCPSGQICNTDTRACYTPSSGSFITGGGSATASKKKSLVISTAPASLSSVKGVEKSFIISLTDSGETNFTGVKLEIISDCASCAFSYFNGNIDINTGQKKDYTASVTANTSGTYSATVKAISGATNSTSLALVVTECEPGAAKCSGSDLLTCSQDGSRVGTTSCENGCSGGRCLNPPASNATEGNKTTTEKQSPELDPTFAAGVIIAFSVVAVALIIVFLKL